MKLIHRERTVDRELEDKKDAAENDATRDETAPPAPAATDLEVVKMPPVDVPIKMTIERKSSDNHWPRKMRSDITRSRVI